MTKLNWTVVNNCVEDKIWCKFRRYDFVEIDWELLKLI